MQIMCHEMNPLLAGSIVIMFYLLNERKSDALQCERQIAEVNMIQWDWRFNNPFVGPSETRTIAECDSYPL